MNYYDETEWQEADMDAMTMVLGRLHCGVEDCCGYFSADKWTEVAELAANLVGMDEYPLA